MKRILACAIAFFLVLGTCGLFFTSCSSNELYSEGNGELNVVCTIFAPFEFARKIGGDRVTVTLLQDNGADLHNYSPTTATLEALSAADVFIYIGGESDEKWVSDAIKSSGNDDIVTICLMDHVEIIHAELENDWLGHDHSNHEHEHGEHDHDGHTHTGDEHVWTSPKNVIKIVEAIRKAFTQKDSDGAMTYEANAKAYTARLKELDEKFASAAEYASADLLVFADRFPFIYLMHDYAIPYKAAFSGCSTEVNASFETQVGLINAVKNYNLKYVITIEGSNKALAEAIANETGCEILELDSMQSVTRSDIEAGADYIEIMTHNLEIIKEALS
jgi:zinc transport system substrate-binding protein